MFDINYSWKRAKKLLALGFQTCGVASFPCLEHESLFDINYRWKRAKKLLADTLFIKESFSCFS
jgi:hypothetical protein